MDYLYHNLMLRFNFCGTT